MRPKSGDLGESLGDVFDQLSDNSVKGGNRIVGAGDGTAHHNVALRHAR